MASSGNSSDADDGRGAPVLGAEAIDIVRRSPLPVVILQIPNEVIVAASSAAGELLGSEGEAVEGRNFEDFTLDKPSGGLGLIFAGRLQGYETSRQLRSEGGSLPARVWVRGFGERVPPEFVLAVISSDTAWNLIDVPMLSSPEMPPVIGTADENLLIDRVSSDVESLLGQTPEEILGQSLLSLVTMEDVPKWLAAIAQATIARAGVTMSVHARSTTGARLLCDALVLSMLPPPSCAFVFMPRSSSSETPDRRSDVREQLARLSRGIHAVNLSADLTAMPALRRVPGLAQLSARELEIVSRLLAGDRVPAIARSVFLSQSTVRNHLARVYRKVGVRSQQELIDLLRSPETNGTDQDL
jgi:DNA-binding CsgD family transcriptional regulator/PAS domain-containing protein